MRNGRRGVLLLAAVAVLAAGCSSAAPSAKSIAARIPGCTSPGAPLLGVSADAVQEVRCPTSWGTVWVATFSSAALERSWLSADAAGGGGNDCIQGSGWAAQVSPSNFPTYPYDRKVMRAIGGRMVTIGSCG